jgi:hypothetical protein
MAETCHISAGTQGKKARLEEECVLYSYFNCTRIVLQMFFGIDEVPLSPLNIQVLQFNIRSLI